MKNLASPKKKITRSSVRSRSWVMKKKTKKRKKGTMVRFSAISGSMKWYEIQQPVKCLTNIC
ncbi:MAG: hypothetical protein EON98_05080 [Chitinophagaceae bacterium]|nr:MAG: hypothetical protein EON98_05080 [Chitinophagaceae bacterium]